MELTRMNLSSLHLGGRRLGGGAASPARASRGMQTVVRAVQTPNIAQGIGNAAAAALEVSKAVRMKGVEAPSVEKTFVSMDEDRLGAVDESGLPVVYDKEVIQKYWENEGSALQQRWTEFLGLSVPFLTRVAGFAIAGGAQEVQKNGASLAKDARIIMEKLGPTYIKAGQMMSVRPDILPQEALTELQILQDSVKPFETRIAIAQVEAELGVPLGDVFDEISEDPVAAASLAQVYRARLKGTDEYVAVKVQRPAVLELVSKDLYVLRRAAEVYQGIIERFAPQQRTNYVALLNEWAIGFYTELDFKNEARNQSKLKGLMEEQNVQGVYVPRVYEELTTRRLLVTEWVDGCKLSECEPDEIRELIAVGQEAFLVQLLQVGFFHSDPHPGNILKMADQSKGRIALLDFGLMATIEQADMDTMISSVIHLANKDYRSLVDDFIKLEILPADCDRSKVEPLMDKALTPYVKGGGAKKYEDELKKMYGFDDNRVGGFQAMTQDMLTVMNDIPFSIPPYFALLGRAVVTLEGVALTGNPEYGIVMEAYPFVARKLLSSDRPELQQALQEVLYTKDSSMLGTTRLAVLLNSAMGVVARTEGSAFVDFDTLPEETVSIRDALKYLFSPGAASLRDVLTEEAVGAADVLLRQALRKGSARFFNALPQPIFDFLPKAEDVPILVFLPTPAAAVPAFVAPSQLLEAAAPALSRDEELYAISLGDLAGGVLGEDAAAVAGGDLATDPGAFVRLALSALSTGAVPGTEGSQVLDLANQLLVATGGQPITAGGAEGASGDQAKNLQDLGDAVAELTPEEQAAAAEWGTAVFDKLVERVSARLEPLM